MLPNTFSIQRKWNCNNNKNNQTQTIFLIQDTPMPRRPTHISQHLKATGTLLLLLLYVCSAVAREKNRAIALPFEDSVYNFRMMFEYDSWNRVQRIVYPDSEVVTYNYDLAGNLNRVHTYKANHRDTLIKNNLYDEFGHRTQVNFHSQKQ